jgi:hypothetical protein
MAVSVSFESQDLLSSIEAQWAILTSFVDTHISIAPTLFNVAVNYLAKMIHTAQQNGLISGLAYHVIEGGCSILQYADDTILFIKDDVE